MLGIEPLPQSAEQNDDPEAKADGKQNLPKASEIEVFKTLVPEPGIMDETLNVGELAEQAADDDDNECAKQTVGEELLPARLAPW